jgi:hypothetical protein
MVQTRFHLAKYRDNWQALVKMVKNIWVPQIAGNFLTSRGTIRLSRKTLLHAVS